MPAASLVLVFAATLGSARTWPLRSVLAGAAGPATMTLAYALERRLRPQVEGELDYDDGLVPGQIVAAIMHLPHASDGTASRAASWGASPRPACSSVRRS